MIIDIFTVCDFAQDFQGKLFINGTFDTIWTKQFPATQPNLSIALKLRFDEDDIGFHPLKFKIIHTNGKEDFVNWDLNIPAPAPNMDYFIWQQVININNYIIQNEGNIAFELYMDDVFVQGVSLKVLQIQ